MKNKDELLQEMYNGALVITPNNRLSAQLLDNFAAKYIQKAHAKPRCMPYQSFVRYLLQTIQHNYPEIEHPLLLSSLQERYLWHNLLQNHANINILNPIQEAWSRCRIWQVPLDAPEFQINNQCQLSQSLQTKYHNILQEQNLLSPATAVNYLLKYLQLSGEKFIWACFDDYTPAQELLQTHLQTQGNQVSHFDLQTTTASSYKYVGKDKSDEYQAMLAWLTTRIAANDKSIAVVVPNIAEDGQNIMRLLEKNLPNTKINISLGESLDSFLIIKHALAWLCLDEKIIPQKMARLLLSSPYIAGSQAEFNQRAELAENCKLLYKPQFSLKSLSNECRKFAPILSNILSSFTPYPKKASPIAWVEIFLQRLSEFAFPGEYPLSSQSYQCLQRLKDVLQEFKKLELFTSSMDKSQALASLNDLISQSIFQPQTTQAQINVLGLLEASGCTFDSIWVCNLTDRSLPAKTSLSAFIPIDLQTKLNMPRASSSRELQFAKQQLCRLQSSCKNIVCSYPSFIDDIPMLGSPLLQRFAELPADITSCVKIQPSLEVKLSHYHDEYLLPVNDPSIIKGGTSILARQAKCPFMAFAKHRLSARGKEDISDWPNNLERGQILHKALEIIWQKLGSKSKLQTLNPADMQNLCLDVVTAVINAEANDNSDKLNTLIQNGEIQRLSKLVLAAFTFELARPDFKINAIEKSFDYKISELDFKIRVDRIDDIIGNGQVVIDYKSSIPSTKPWKEERPLEPQLLLYALLNSEVNCIMYLQLKNGKVIANGISATELGIDGVKAIKDGEDWLEYKNTWETQLKTLANEFISGVCQPNPAKPSICQGCDYQDLCARPS